MTDVHAENHPVIIPKRLMPPLLSKERIFVNYCPTLLTRLNAFVIALSLLLFYNLVSPMRRLRLSVRTLGSQPGKRGSTPLGATKFFRVTGDKLRVTGV